MPEEVYAVFRDGAFYPVAPCSLPDDSQVILHIKPVLTARPASGCSEAERREALKRVTERMRNNPIPADAPGLPYSREWLHERG